MVITHFSTLSVYFIYSPRTQRAGLKPGDWGKKFVSVHKKCKLRILYTRMPYNMAWDFENVAILQVK